MALLLGAVACRSASASETVEPSVDALLEEFAVTPEELEDIRFVAEQEGWTLEEAVERLGWQSGFSEFAQDLRERYPDDFAGAKITCEVGLRSGFVAFRDTVPAGVSDDSRLRQLDIEILEMLGFSEADLIEQTQEIHNVMLAVRYEEIVTTYEIETATVSVGAVRRAADRNRSEAEIRAGLPRSARAANVRVEFFNALPCSED